MGSYFVQSVLLREFTFFFFVVIFDIPGCVIKGLRCSHLYFTYLGLGIWYKVNFTTGINKNMDALGKRR